jgi:hypothetical protein
MLDHLERESVGGADLREAECAIDALHRLVR